MKLIDLDTEVIADAQENEWKEKSVEVNVDLGTTINIKKETFGLNSEDVELYSEAFSDFDQKHDGTISTRVSILSLSRRYSNLSIHLLWTINLLRHTIHFGLF